MRHKTEPSGPKLFFCYFMFELRRTQRATVCAEKQRSDISQWYRVNYCRQYVICYMALLNFNNKIENGPTKIRNNNYYCYYYYYSIIIIFYYYL